MKLHIDLRISRNSRNENPFLLIRNPLQHKGLELADYPTLYKGEESPVNSGDIPPLRYIGRKQFQTIERTQAMVMDDLRTQAAIAVLPALVGRTDINLDENGVGMVCALAWEIGTRFAEATELN